MHHFYQSIPPFLLPLSYPLYITASVPPSLHLVFLTTLFLIGHSHDVHGLQRVLKLVQVIHTGHRQVPIGQEFVVLWVIEEELHHCPYHSASGKK